VTGPTEPTKTRNRILVVEDDPTFRQVVESILGQAGYETISVEDGAQALELIVRESFDLVLLDIWLPKMNGLELLSRLDARGLRPKVVILTGDNTSDTVLETVKADAYHYLVKPVEGKVLIDVVRDALVAPSPGPIEVISAKANWVELLVPCQINAPSRVRSFLQHLESDLPEAARESIGQAFQELLMNAIEWGGELDPDLKVRISFLRTARMLMYRILDPGIGFRPDDLGHAAVGNPEGEPFKHMTEREEKGIRPGGFGLVMARSLVDELIYNEAHNEVVFVKYLD
jgi:CheY-like chemotaxis protein/anti-sigma regulatory factor (Ser/Thr protein kinase)